MKTHPVNMSTENNNFVMDHQVFENDSALDEEYSGDLNIK